MRLTFSITNRCDKACAHCGLSSSPSETQDLTNSVMKTAIDQIVSFPPDSIALNRGHGAEVRFSGGEPFLRYDDMLEISKYAIDNGVSRIGCTTNAGWATSMDVALKKLEDFKKSGLQDLRLSCDNFHDYDKQLGCIRNAFAAAVKLDIPIGIKVVVHKGSLRASDILQALEDLTRDIIFFVEELSLLPVGRASNIPDSQLLKLPGIPSGRCDMMGNYVLDVEGNVYPCCVPGKPRLLNSGNIQDEPIGELIRKADNNSLFKLIHLKGPAYFVPFLEENGLEIQPGSFVNRCHLCQHILNEADKNKNIMKGLMDAIKAWEKEQTMLHSTLDLIENFLFKAE